MTTETKVSSHGSASRKRHRGEATGIGLETPSGRRPKVKNALSYFRSSGLFQIVRKSPDGRIRSIREGIPAAYVADLAQMLEWRQDTLFSNLNWPRSTIIRKISRNQILDAGQSERLIKVADLIAQVAEMVERSGRPEGFDAAAWTGQWLLKPSPALGGQAPASFLDTTEGARLVQQLLSQMETGAYA